MQVPPSVLSNHLRAIMGVLLSLKKRPVIRWERMSQAGRKLAVEVQVSVAFSTGGTSAQTRPPCNIHLIASCLTFGPQLDHHPCCSYWVSEKYQPAADVQIAGMTQSPLYFRSGRIKRWSTSCAASQTAASG
jgi:hypothetical protein